MMSCQDLPKPVIVISCLFCMVLRCFKIPGTLIKLCHLVSITTTCEENAPLWDDKCIAFPWVTFPMVHADAAVRDVPLPPVWAFHVVHPIFFCGCFLRNVEVQLTLPGRKDQVS